MFKSSKAPDVPSKAPVPDDTVDVADKPFTLSVYGSDITSLTVKVIGGRIPIKLGGRFELEVVEIERRVIER